MRNLIFPPLRSNFSNIFANIAFALGLFGVPGGRELFRGFFLAVLKVVCIFVGDKKGFEEAGFVTGFV